MPGCPMPRGDRRAGFTLIELLAVIAVILILMGLLLPTLGGIRDRAQTTVCASQLGQIIKAATRYAVDNNGEYPDVWRWVWSDNSSALWVEWAQPETVYRGQLYTNYLGSDPRIFLCPVFRQAPSWNPAFSHLTPYVGYSMNEYLWTDVSYTTWYSRSKLHRSQIANPSTLGIFADEGTVVLPWAPVVINNLCLGVGDYKVPGSYCDGLAAFHNPPGRDITQGKGNVAYGDGRVRTEDPTNSVALFTPSQYKL